MPRPPQTRSAEYKPTQQQQGTHSSSRAIGPCFGAAISGVWARTRELATYVSNELNVTAAHGVLPAQSVGHWPWLVLYVW